MIDITLSQYINDTIVHYIENNDKSVRERVNAFWDIYDLLLQELTKTEKQLFPNAYTRSVFVLDYYKDRIENRLKNQLNRVWFLIKEINQNKRSCSDYDYNLIVCSICDFVSIFSPQSLPSTIQNYLNRNKQQFSINRIIRDEYLLLDVVVQEVGDLQTFGDSKYFVLSCQSDEIGAVQIKIWNDLAKLRPCFWKYARVILTDVEKDNVPNGEENITFFKTNSQTLITIDPDFVFDASSLAACFTDSGSHSLLYILNNYISIASNYYIFRGNIVNSYLDSCFEGKKETIESIFYDLIRRQPTTSLVFDDNTLLKLNVELPHHFATIDKVVGQYINNNNMLEPTFISELFGIRGRLDLLTEPLPLIEHRKDVVELKTSKDPLPFGMQIYEKDHVQATCYNLLLESIDKERRGSSAILYSSVNIGFLRDSTNNVSIKRKTLFLRNVVAYRLYCMTKSVEDVLKSINVAAFNGLGLFSNTIKDINNFANKISAASDLERAYFFEFSQFVSKEHRAAMLGCANERGSEGFSSLWNKSIFEKERAYKVLAYLNFKEGNDNSLCFSKSEKTAKVSTFREGDFVLLYPQEANGDLLPTKHQIFKAVIVKITSKEIKVKLFNKFIDIKHFEQYKSWAIETELFELGFKMMYESLYRFINFPTEKKNLLLGVSEPTFRNVSINLPSYLKPQQKNIIKKAVSANDYFLIQGPPGTGKTKTILKELVETLVANPDEKIILLAFTNRAVDEICESMKSIDFGGAIFRLGHEEGTSHKDLLLSNFAKDKSPAQIREAIQGCRIFISTVLTFLRNSELQHNVNFSTAIIDEASQLLEPQLIGVLGSVERFILIGDEKQLPAVVVQSEDDTKTDSVHLHSIGIYNLRNSVFERLLSNSKDKGWHNAYDILADQARMHIQIQNFPNRYFYGERLQPILLKQQAPQMDLFGSNENDLTKIIGNSRVLFIPTKADGVDKTNTKEAELVVLFIKKLKSVYQGKFSEDTLGVITPYRAQIGEIRKQLTDELNEIITIDTVERYQGSQKKIIIISFAVNNEYQLKNLNTMNTIGGVEVDRKLNVALTRAKDLLIVFGCEEILSKSPIYEKFIAYCKQNQFYKNITVGKK